VKRILNVIKMHGETIKIFVSLLLSVSVISIDINMCSCSCCVPRTV
jgi:hypothetical protein